MLSWTDEQWNRGIPPIQLQKILRQCVTELQVDEGKVDKAGNQASKITADVLGSCHNIKRYFVYHASLILELPDLLKLEPFLDVQTIDLAFKETAEKYKGKALLDEMRKEFVAYTLPQTFESVKISGGMLLYGPPGTGKTTLTDVLPRKMGFTAVCEALSSAEVNRSYVGQTEQLLIDLLTRAKRLPHLMCMIAVDEIDGLAPKRDDKSSQSKNDALNILLAFVGGAKAVKNLVFMASTNRLKMMDQAFLRRISAQFFVGRPQPNVRFEILQKVNRDLDAQGWRGSRLSDEHLANLVVWTTNFSGAALGALVSDLIVFAVRALRGTRQFSDRMILGIVDKISQQFSLSVGAKSLACIFNDLLGKGRTPDLIPSTISQHEMHEQLTGLIIADLQRNCFIVETKVGEFNLLLPKGPKTMDELLAISVSFATKYEIDAVQMFDLDLLLNNAAYDDSKKQEIIQEKIEEMARYPKSLAIIDVDSLVGVNDSESTSSMGGSTNSSVSNQAMYSLVGNIIMRRNVSIQEEVVQSEEPHTNPQSKATATATVAAPAQKLATVERMEKIQSKEKEKEKQKKLNTAEAAPVASVISDVSVTQKQCWVVVACQNEHLLNRILKEKTHKETAEHREERNKREEEDKLIRRCQLCDVDFTRADNEKGLNCNYHDGYIYNPSLPGELWDEDPIHPGELYSKAAEHVIAKQRHAKAKAGGDDDAKQPGGAAAAGNATQPVDSSEELNKFKYLCCLNSCRPKSTGCRKGEHTENAADAAKKVRDYKMEYKQLLDICQGSTAGAQRLAFPQRAEKMGKGKTVGFNV